MDASHWHALGAGYLIGCAVTGSGTLCLFGSKFLDAVREGERITAKVELLYEQQKHPEPTP